MITPFIYAAILLIVQIFVVLVLSYTLWLLISFKKVFERGYSKGKQF